MSKYKVGDKFIIEIGHSTVEPSHTVKYFVKGFRNVQFSEYGLDCLERYDAEAKANTDYNAGYEDGLRDAWNRAKIIVNLDGEQIYNRFGVRFMDEIFDKFSASEAENKMVGRS